MPSHSENNFLIHFEFLRDKFSKLTDEHIKIIRHVFDIKTELGPVSASDAPSLYSVSTLSSAEMP